MVIFNSYVKLPEGTHYNDPKSFAHLKKHLEDLSAAMIGLQVDSGACGPTQLFVGLCRDMYIYIYTYNLFQQFICNLRDLFLCQLMATDKSTLVCLKLGVPNF